MTPKEQAEQLYIEFYPTWLDNGMVVKKKYGKELAVKSVDVVINTLENIAKPEYVHFYEKTQDEGGNDGYAEIEFWEQVKIEIEAL